MNHLVKAKIFYDAHNYEQALRSSDLALAKLNAMKKRPLQDISDALSWKCHSLKFLDRHAEALQCAKDKYNMWAMARGPAHPLTIHAAFYLIECLIHNKEYEDAALFARTLWEIIHTNNHRDNEIPADRRQKYVANSAELLATAIFRLAESGGIPPEEKQKAGEEAIARARQAVEIYRQEYGSESVKVGGALGALADVLQCFKGDNDDEALGLYQQANAIHTRVYGRMSVNVGAGEFNLGETYYQRARRAAVANVLDKCVGSLKLALPHFHEAARIYRATNHLDSARNSLGRVVEIDKKLREAEAAAIAAASVATATTATTVPTATTATEPTLPTLPTATAPTTAASTKG